MKRREHATLSDLRSCIKERDNRKRRKNNDSSETHDFYHVVSV